MGLFRKKGKAEAAHIAPQAEEEPEREVTTVTISAETKRVHESIATLLSDYQKLTSKNIYLTLSEYDHHLKGFTSLAQAFEKIYELMQFDRERLAEIENYNKQANKKREELLTQLGEKPPTAESEEEADSNDKSKGKQAKK